MINVAHFDRFFDVIIVSGTFLILLFSIYLWISKRGYKLLNRFIAVVLIARVGQNLLYVLLKSEQLINFPYLLNLFLPFSYAAPACLYLYVDCFIKKKTAITKEEWLHFIPAVLALVEMLPKYFSSLIDWEPITKQIAENPASLLNSRGYLPYYYHVVLRPPLFIVYLFFTWRTLIGSKILNNKTTDSSIKTWLLFLLVSVTIVQIVRFLLLVSNPEGIFIGVPLEPHFQWFVVINTSAFIGLLFYFFYKQAILYKCFFVSGEIEPARVKSAASIDSEANSNKIMSDTLGQSYLETIEEFIKLKRPFLKHDFHIMDLAQELKIPIHHCSFVINSIIGSNFRDWINSYRIRDFIEQFPSKSDKMTIEAIANESGFKSSTTFYRAFKKETGKMPKIYFKEYSLCDKLIEI